MDYPLTAIISDLHGNAPAVETVLADAAQRGVERLVCLGDVVGYGANPCHNLDLVMRLCVEDPRPIDGFGELEPGLCLLGNHEHAVLHGDAYDFNPRARAAIEWTRDQLNRGEEREESYVYWDFLGSLEPADRDEAAQYAHGSPRDPLREYVVPNDVHDPDKLRENFDRIESRVCFVGHSHVPAVYREDGQAFLPRSSGDTWDLESHRDQRALINVGSVGQPRDGDPRLSYVLFDGRRVTFHRLPYDIEAAADAIRAVPELPDFLADRLAHGR